MRVRLAGGVVGAMTAEKAQLYQSEGSLVTGDLKKGEGCLYLPVAAIKKRVRMSLSREPSNEVGGYGELNGWGRP